MMNSKTIWKPGIGKITKVSKDITLEPTSGIYSTPYEHPAAQSQSVDACWVMAYKHKTQSFMKNGGQQKYLDKALVMEQNRFIQRNKEIQQQPLGDILKKRWS